MLRLLSSKKNLVLKHVALTRVHALAPASFHKTIRNFDEEEEEEKPKKQKKPLVRPPIHPALVPRRRNGLTVKTFLEAIGKDCGQYHDRFEDWTDLFVMKSRVMRKLEIPIKQRKWILKWVHLYRCGITPGVPPRKQKEWKPKIAKW